MTLRILTFTVLTGAALTVAVPAAAQDAAEKGAAVYTAQKCIQCHSIAGKGVAKGPLDGVGSKLTADEIRAWIVTPKEMTAKTKAKRTPAMRAYPALAKEDVEALVAYLQTLKKK